MWGIVLGVDRVLTPNRDLSVMDPKRVTKKSLEIGYWYADQKSITKSDGLLTNDLTITTTLKSHYCDDFSDFIEQN